MMMFSQTQSQTPGGFKSDSQNTIMMKLAKFMTAKRITDDLPHLQSCPKLYKLAPLQSRHINTNLPQIPTGHTFSAY